MAATGTIPQGLLKQARKTGVLNLPNRGLSSVPAEVWSINLPPTKENSATSFDSDDHWWEYVELTKLNLASNELTEISESLENFPNLSTIDVHDNKLAKLPEAFSKLQNLKRIDLSHNLFPVINNFDSFRSMTVLLLQHNKLTDILCFENSPSVCESLDLSHNLLSNLSPLINEMVNLRSLNVSNNQLSSLPSINRLKSLTLLNLNNNKLKELPDCFNNLQNLKQLHLRNNMLVTLPSTRGCQNLVEIYLGNNSLKMLPYDLPNNIMILEVRDNKIIGLPDSITSFRKLERLDIANNSISKLHPEIGNMSLKVLVLDGNPLKSIRRDVINRGTQAVLSHLKSRIVVTEDATGDGNNSALPQSAQSTDLHRMHELSTTGKLKILKETPEVVEQKLKQASEIPLQEVHVTQCFLIQFPSTLLHFETSLTVLNVAFNKLQTIPNAIASLSSLTHLNFSNNSLSTLPSEFGNLKQLQELNISTNKFSELPSCLYGLESLQHLLADGNQIVSLNVPGLRSITNLATISLQNNSIGQVPPELVLIKKLQTLKLEGNVFRVPRQSIVQKGSAAVIEYLRSRIPT